MSGPRFLTHLTAAAMTTIAAAACSLGVAAPAALAAGIQLQGSGQLTSNLSSATCFAFDQPNTTVTDCLISGFGQPITLTATPQAGITPQWKFVRWDSDGNCKNSTTTSCTTTASDVRAIFQDDTAPTFGSLLAMPSTTVDGQMNLFFSADETVTSAFCSIDNGPEVACLSNQGQTGLVSSPLPEGVHTLRARGTDVSGNGGTFSDTPMTFTVYNTTLDSGPADFTPDHSPDFKFSTKTGKSFDCSLDGAAFTACLTKGAKAGTKSYTGLAEGVHTFKVQTKDAAFANGYDAFPVVRTWTIDSTAPDLTLSAASGPVESSLRAGDKETFLFTSTDATTGVQCHLDDAPFAACQSGITLERLSAGAHRFEVKAVDRAGNTSPTLARTWTTALQDRDGDGFNESIDCNDAHATIRPGAIEIAGNAVDENCDGIVQPADPLPLPPVEQTGLGETKPVVGKVADVELKTKLTAGKTSTKFKLISLEPVPTGAAITVSCKGSKCPKALKGKGQIVPAAAGSVSLGKAIGASLKAGITVTITVAKPGETSLILGVAVRANKKPLVTRKCLPAGAKKPEAC